MKKKLLLFLSLFVIILSITTVSLAITGNLLIPLEITVGDNPDVPVDAIAGPLLGMAKWAGLTIGIGMLLYIGVKYVTAGATGKADVKSTLVPWMIGATVIICAGAIVTGVFESFGGP